MDTKILETFLPLLAEKSAEVIMPWYGNHKISISSKSDETPVTQADRDAEEVLRGLINKQFPDHGIIGEEFGTENEDAEYVWTLDPIDGTKSFITSVPLFGTLIGLMRNKKPLIGLMHQPVIKQLCIGDGTKTTINGKEVQCRQKALSESTLLASSITGIPSIHDGDGWNALVDKVKMLRTWGDCYGYCLVASGWADIMVDDVLEIWDLVPFIPIIEGAGGAISDWNGNNTIKSDGTFVRSCVAGHPVTHKEAINILNKNH